ncbi:MAG TPA: DUF2059 domain-containing protein [Epsilonproteobacteria bacterium]|nr:DUF2059 domain-containing protein [Campylobacterota bacterium]
MIKQTSKTLLVVATLALPLSLQAQCGAAPSATKVAPKSAKCGQGKCGGKKASMKKDAPAKTTISAHAANSAALTLLATMNMKESYEGMIKRITQMQIQASPQLKAIEPAIEAFFTKFMGWEAQRGDIAALYAKNYTTKELQELTKFYQTPLGQKTVQLMPQLAAASAQIGQNKMMQHMPEMKAMIEAELKKINANK